MSVRYVIVCPLRPLNVGDRYRRADWPLHVTVAGNFLWDASESVLTERVAAALRGHRAIDLVVGEEAMFGPAHTIRVNQTIPDARLNTLHESLIDDRMQFAEPQFLRAGFHGHITHVAEGQRVAGDHVKLDHVALVEVADPSVVRAVWPLAG